MLVLKIMMLMVLTWAHNPENPEKTRKKLFCCCCFWCCFRWGKIEQKYFAQNWRPQIPKTEDKTYEVYSISRQQYTGSKNNKNNNNSKANKPNGRKDETVAAEEETTNKCQMSDAKCVYNRTIHLKWYLAAAVKPWNGIQTPTPSAVAISSSVIVLWWPVAVRDWNIHSSSLLGFFTRFFRGRMLLKTHAYAEAPRSRATYSIQGLYEKEHSFNGVKLLWFRRIVREVYSSTEVCVSQQLVG